MKKLLVGGFSGLLISASAFASAFGTGDLVIVRLGDGSAAIDNKSTATFLDEYTTSGAFVQSIALPTAANGANGAFTLQGSSTSEGFLQLSGNGQYLTLGGYNIAPGTATPSGVAGTGRTIALVNANGTVDTSTVLTSGTSGNIRSVYSQNGSAFYASSSSLGVGYVTAGGSAATQLSSTPVNTRVVRGFNGQLYITSATTTWQDISTVGTGMPTTSGQTTTLLNGFPTASGPSPYSFFFNSAGNTAWIADDRTTAAGGVQKWTLSGGVWSQVTTFSPATGEGIRGMTADFSGANPIFYGITTESTADKLVKIVDNGDGTSTTTVLATVGNNEIFRGIDFAPVAVPEPATFALIGLGLAGLLVSRRRK